MDESDTTNVSTSRTDDVEDATELAETSNITKIFLYAGNSYHGRAIVHALKHQESPLPEVVSATSVHDEAHDGSVGSTTDPSSLNQSRSLPILETPDHQYQITSCLDPSRSCSVDDKVPIDHYIDQDSSELEQMILEQDILIYDTNFDVKGVNDALDIVKMLDKWAQEEDIGGMKKKRFILISNLMTWAMTENSPEAPLSNKDYRKRRPHPCYRRYLRLEQEVTNLQVKYKEKLDTLILCPGITFGYEEDILHYFFKMALYNKQDIEMFEPGNNGLPLIHVSDLAKLVKHVIESDFSKEKYLLGFNPVIKYQGFVLGIAKLITGMDDVRLKVCPKERMLLIDRRLLTQRSYDKLTLNLNVTVSDFGSFTFEQDVDKIVQKSVQEYFEAYSIKPVKILVHGPPSCGKTTLAKALACYYAAYYIHPDDVLDEALIRLEKKLKRGKDYVESMKKYEGLSKDELFMGMVEKAKEDVSKWKTEVQIIKEALKSKDQTSIKQLKEKYLLERLSSRACTSNQGYIIDTLLYDIDSVERIFLSDTQGATEDTFEEDLSETRSNESTEVEDAPLRTPSKKKVSIDDEADEVSDDEPEIMEKEVSETDSVANVLIKEELRPDIFIYLKWDETILKKEESCTCQEYIDQFPVHPPSSYSCSLSTCTLFGGHSTNSFSNVSDIDPCRPFPNCQDLDKVLWNPSIQKAVETHERKRLEGFLETEYEDRSLYTFMLDHGLIPFEIEIDEETTVESIYTTIKEKLGPRNDYLISDAKREEERRACEEIKRRAREREEAEACAEIEKKCLAKKKQIEEKLHRMKIVKKAEMSQIEACSLPLRTYLIKCIVPKLTEALIEVARVRPQDPIDYLAEYLFRNNPEGCMFDPCLPDAVTKKIMEERMTEIGDTDPCYSYCKCLYEKDESSDEDPE